MALEPMVDPDVNRCRGEPGLGPVAAWTGLDPSQQPGARADVPGRPPHFVQGASIVPAPFAAAGPAVGQDQVARPVLVDVVADVVLDRRVAVDVGADLGE